MEYTWHICMLWGRTSPQYNVATTTVYNRNSSITFRIGNEMAGSSDRIIYCDMFWSYWTLLHLASCSIHVRISRFYSKALSEIFQSNSNNNRKPSTKPDPCNIVHETFAQKHFIVNKPTVIGVNWTCAFGLTWHYIQISFNHVTELPAAVQQQNVFFPNSNFTSVTLCISTHPKQAIENTAR